MPQVFLNPMPQCQCSAIFRQFHPFFFAVLLHLHQVGWEMSVKTCSDLSRDVQSDSSLDSSLATPWLSDWGWSHSFQILSICFGSLSCWQINHHPSPEQWGCYTVCLFTLLLSFFPLSIRTAIKYVETAVPISISAIGSKKMKQKTEQIYFQVQFGV